MSHVPQQLIIKGEPHVLVITRNMSFWQQCLSTAGHYLHPVDFGVDGCTQQVALTKQGTATSLFVSPDDLARWSDAVIAAVETEEKQAQLITHYHEFAHDVLESLRKALLHLTPETWDIFQKTYKRFTAGFFLTSTIGRAVPDLLLKKLKEKNCTDDDIVHIMATITYPEEHTPLFDSQLDLLKIGKEVQSGTLAPSAIDERLEKWLSRHGFIPVNFCEEPWTLVDARRQLQEVLSSDCSAAYQQAVDHHESIIAEGKRLLTSFQDKELTQLAKAVQIGTTLNEFRKNIVCRVSLEFRPVFIEIAQRAKLSHWRDCFYLFPEEMIHVLKGTLTDARSNIAGREEIAYTVDDEGNIFLLSKEEADMLSQHVSQLQGQSQTMQETAISVKGTIVCKGKVTGTAKIILSSKDFHKFSAGDILVTTMTSVDFVPLMQMAAAFVTNEGGVTSHASIVAREMNKPCVIGTKNATQVFKDGDLIEVDAEKGIVTRL